MLQYETMKLDAAQRRSKWDATWRWSEHRHQRRDGWFQRPKHTSDFNCEYWGRDRDRDYKGNYWGKSIRGPVIREEGLVAINIESKEFIIKATDSITISERKNGKSHKISISKSSAIWLAETLNHPPLARVGWSVSRFEGSFVTKFQWDSNRYGNYVRLTAAQEGRVGNIFIPTGPNSEGIFLFVKAITDAVNLRGDNAYIPGEERVDKEVKGCEEPSRMQKKYGEKEDKTEEGITGKGEEMEMRKPSISSELFDLDIQEATLIGDGSDKGQKSIPEQQQEGREEDPTEKLFLPVFQAAENQIKEA
ncbi:unnamed protein product [Cuscuta campestris]|uniref:Uncharacterized protein n=2 Tax=Cuscuta sect. Cleistogrammica TaxID=1824901 RepID=A0A484KHI5_9ASTE|nr:hypothetical protein DM860_006347 [Cuscuta australis]VFQ62627.1 unnamed protein product [Cuscuta campestris]